MGDILGKVASNVAVGLEYVDSFAFKCKVDFFARNERMKCQLDPSVVNVCVGITVCCGLLPFEEWELRPALR